MTLTFDQLRRYAVARSLFKPTTLPRAIQRLGFVQADPIRAPARAQDLTLRHRVAGYRAGDLERRYPRLPLEEDFFVNYGFLPREHHQLMHPRKAREAADLIRGKSVAEARSVLFFANRNSARVVAAVLDSAVANAEHNNALSADDLYVTEARVDEGPTLKRWQFRAMGRVNRIRKRSSHITVAVDQREGRS